MKGEIKNVLDVDMKFEKPINCDLECDAEKNSAEIKINNSFNKLI